MKKNLFYLFALVCSMSLFTACSDDEGGDGDNLGKVISEEIVGSYSGNLEVSVNGGDPMDASLNVSVAQNGENAVDFSITGLAIGTGITVSDIALDKCLVTKKSDNTYAFSATVEGMELEATMVVVPVPITADVTISGEFVTGGTATNLSIDLDINATNLNQLIKGTYEGTRDAAE